MRPISKPPNQTTIKISTIRPIAKNIEKYGLDIENKYNLKLASINYDLDPYLSDIVINYEFCIYNMPLSKLAKTINILRRRKSIYQIRLESEIN